MLKNLLTVLSGNVIAQAIAFASMPVLSRLYAPEDLLVFHLYMTTLPVVMILATLRFDLALLVARAGLEARGVLQLALGLPWIVAVILGVGIWMARAPILAWQPILAPLLWLVPVMVLVGSISHVLANLPLRVRKYGVSAQAKVLQTSTGSLGGIALAGMSGVGLVLADMAARAAMGGYLWWRMAHTIPGALRPLPARVLGRVFCRLREYPSFVVPSSLMSALVGVIAPLAFINIYDTQAAGQFAFLERFVVFPVSAISVALATVFMGDFSFLVRENPTKVRAAFWRLVGTLAAIGVPLCVLGALVGPQAVPFVFGAQWVQAGAVTPHIMPLVLGAFILVPISTALLIFEQRRLQLFWDGGRLVLSLGLFAWLGTLNELTLAQGVAIYSWYQAALTLVFVWLADRAARRLTASAPRARKSRS